MCSANNHDHFSTLLFIFSSLLASSSLSQGYGSQMDGHSAGNIQGVISYTRALGCGTAGRKRRVIILHLGAAGNKFLHKVQIYRILFMLASIFPAGSIYWANSPLSVYGKAMVQHLWLLYTVEGPHRAPYKLNKWLDSPGAGCLLPSC